MSCKCDDGIGQFVCKKHSTPENDPFHYLLYGKRQDQAEREAFNRDATYDELEEEEEEGAG